MKACFISYRHPGDPRGQRLIETFYKELRTQLSLYVPKPDVYLDVERLRAGALFRPELAQALCRSSSMILLFTPLYFDRQHTFCAREYKAMEDLEESRLEHCPDELKNDGLILPVVLRGVLPEAVRPRQGVKFLDVLHHRDFERKRGCLVRMEQLAQEVARRFLALRDLDLGPCDDFGFPSDDEIGDWLETVVTEPPGLPNR